MRRLARVGVSSALLLLGCQPAPMTAQGGGPGRAAVDFAFPGLEGQVISDEAVAGRVTVLLFATTFDLDSQTQAKQLEDLYRTHTPRLNAVLVFLEAPQYAELARSFRDVLGLSYPVAFADQEELRSSRRFPPVLAVPTWIVLDRSSKVRAQFVGAVDRTGLEKLALAAE